jgi:hypothetical protein
MEHEAGVSSSLNGIASRDLADCLSYASVLEKFRDLMAVR